MIEKENTMALLSPAAVRRVRSGDSRSTTSRMSSGAGNYSRMSNITAATSAVLTNRISNNNKRKINSTQQRQLEKESFERYRMEPYRKFQSSPVNEILKEVVQTLFDDSNNDVMVAYDAELFRRLSKEASELLKDKVKELNFSRCRIVSMVYAGHKIHRTSMQASSLVLLDKGVDGFTEYTFTKRDFFVTAIVYGIHKV